MENYKEIAITNRHLCKGDFLQKVDEICKKSVDRLILREKDLSAKDYSILAKKVVEITRQNNLPLTAHTYWQEAISLEIQNIHLPYSLFLENSTNIKKDFSEIGISIHSLEEGLEAEQQGADYVMFGHIFTTACKEGLAPRGLTTLEKLCYSLKIPVYAVGGITEENAKQVLKAGASGLCRMSYYMK